MVDLRPELAVTVVAAVLGSVLIILVVLLLIFAPAKLRKTPVFILCIIALCFGVALAILLCIPEALFILFPTRSPDKNIVLAGTLLCPLMSIFVDSIFLYRLRSIYPPQYYTRRKITLLISPSLLLKFLRLASLSYGGCVLARIDVGQWSHVFAGKAEFIMEVMDNGYISILFLLHLKKASRLYMESAGVHNIAEPELNPYATRLRTLSFLTFIFNLLIPNALSVTCLALTFGPASTKLISLLTCLFYANNVAQIVGVLVVVVWATSARDWRTGYPADDDLETIVFRSRRTRRSSSGRRRGRVGEHIGMGRMSGDERRTHTLTWELYGMDLPRLPVAAAAARESLVVPMPVNIPMNSVL